MKLIKDLGMLYPVEGSTQRKRYGMYECPSCFRLSKHQQYQMKSRKDKACKSCITIATHTKHGEHATTSRMYRMWSRIKRCCYNTNSKDYQYYGAKGVTMCDEWKEDYTIFKTWCETNGYGDELTIDKDILCDELNINPKIYSPNTCQFISKSDNIAYANRNRNGFESVSIPEEIKWENIND